MLCFMQANFILQWCSILILLFRGNDVRTYGTSLATEFAIFGVWVRPMIYLSSMWANNETGEVPKSTKALVVFIALNMSVCYGSPAPLARVSDEMAS